MPKYLLLIILLVLSSRTSAEETLILLERSGSLIFTHKLSQFLNKSEFNHPVHIGFIDSSFSSLSTKQQISSSEIYIESIYLRAGIDNEANISQIISQGAGPALFLEKNPQFLPNAKRIFTHISWQPQTGDLVPSDISLYETIAHIGTLIPNIKKLILIGNESNHSNILIKQSMEIANLFPDLILESLNYAEASFNSSFNANDTAALITHPPEILTEERMLTSLQNTNIPIFFMFLNEFSLEQYKPVGGLVVDPILLADLIAQLTNRKRVFESEIKVTKGLYHAESLQKYNIDLSKLTLKNYDIVGAKIYSTEQVQLYLLISSAIITIVILLYLKALSRTNVVLKEQAKAAEAMSASKNELLANISHELRTPLNAINLTFQALEQKKQPTEPKLIDAGKKASLHLKNIVDNVLDFHKSSTGVFSTDIKWMHKRQLYDAVAIHRADAQNKGLTFHTHGYEQLPEFLHTDEKLIVQVIHNLLSNALKFTVHGSITLTFAHNNDVLQFTIKDTGIGMDEHGLSILFEPFSQVSHGIQKKYQGTGLGMALCKEFIELLNGDINVSSKIGVGTEFNLTIPMKGKTTSDEADSAKANVPLVHLPLNVLVVEDEAINREMLEFLLSQHCNNVFSAASGIEALSILKNQPVDIILSDIRMPEMDGLTLQMNVKEQYPEIPVIALTGNAFDSDCDLYYEKGFKAVLPKPININDVLNALNQHALSAKT